MGTMISHRGGTGSTELCARCQFRFDIWICVENFVYLYKHILHAIIFALLIIVAVQHINKNRLNCFIV
jgi:hypothetical protein